MEYQYYGDKLADFWPKSADFWPKSANFWLTSGRIRPVRPEWQPFLGMDLHIGVKKNRFFSAASVVGRIGNPSYRQ
jgi:hypothetical protein